MANNENLKPFKKGKGKDRDPRINKYGRPKDIGILRKLAQRIANEPVAVRNGYTLTMVEVMLRNMAASKNATREKTFLEYAYGKVKEEIDHTTKGEKITWESFIKDDKPGASSE